MVTRWSQGRTYKDLYVCDLRAGHESQTFKAAKAAKAVKAAKVVLAVKAAKAAKAV